MRLGELLNKIFRKRNQPGVEDRKMAEDIYGASEHTVGEEDRVERVEKKIVAEQTGRSLTWRERLQIKNVNVALVTGVVVGAVMLALLAVLYVRLSNSAFKEENVTVSIVGPEIVEVGQIAKYTVTLENKNRVKLQNTSLNIKLPDNFILQKNNFIVDRNLSGAKISIGTLKGHSQKKYTIEVTVNYDNDIHEVLKVFAKYKPANISSYFQADAQKNIKLVKSNLAMLIDSVDTASSGEMVSFDVILKNNDNNAVENLLLKADYPEGFTFDYSDSEPVDDTTNEWLVDKLEAGEQYKINIQGRLSGQLDVIKLFKFALKDKMKNSILAQSEHGIKIIPTKVLLEETVKNHNVYPGDYIDYRVLFKNNTSVPLRNLVLVTHLPGRYINRQRVTVRDGYYDSRENTITWKAGDNQQLEILQPGEEGQVEFRVGIEDNIIPKDKNDKNPYLRSYSEIESLDVDSPIFENKKITSSKLKIPINSVAQLASVARYIPENPDEATEGILKVNQKTKIKITLNLSNTTNRLKDVKLLADLPSGVQWEEQIYPKGDNLKFDERSHQLKWNIGTVEVGTGILSPPEKAEFVISIIPSINQVGQGINLLKNVRISAKDTFTGNSIGYEFKAITSQMTDGLKDGLVVGE